MPRTDIQRMPDSHRTAFLRALAAEINRLRDDPEQWAKVQAKAEELGGKEK